MGNTRIPKFTYPGDDPELDRRLNEARIDGEADLTSYPDVFGRRKPPSAAEVDQEAKTIPPRSPWIGDNATIDKAGLPSSLMRRTKAASAASTGPVVTEMPAAVQPNPQARWLLLGVLAIIGPVALVATIVFGPTTGTQGTVSTPPSSASVAATTALPVTRAAPAPNVTAVSRIEENEAATTAPTVDGGAAPIAPIRRTVTPRPSTDDPYSEPPQKPGAGKPDSKRLLY